MQRVDISWYEKHEQLGSSLVKLFSDLHVSTFSLEALTAMSIWKSLLFLEGKGRAAILSRLVGIPLHIIHPTLYSPNLSNYSLQGTRSAIAGGTTTIIAFAPQCKHETSLLDILDATHEKASGVCYTDYSFHMLVSNPSPSVLSEFPTLRQRGISSLKIYMTYAALQLRDNQILDVLLASRCEGITTMIHAENGDVLTWMTSQLESRGLIAPKYHASSRPQLVETEATNRAISLSELIDAPLLIVHVSSPSAASHIRAAQTRGLPVYAETCPQYLFLTREDLSHPGFEGAKCVCSPPPRDSATDHEAIWQGLRNGTFTILSSDHCPFKYEDTEQGKKSILSADFPEGKFSGIPNGLPGLETRLPLVLSQAKERGLSLQKFVELTSTNPARLYGLYPRKGALIPGVSDADLTVWYPEGKLPPFGLKNEMLHHACDYTPFEGRELDQWPRYTILRGEVVWDREHGGVVGGKGYGIFLERGESSLPGPRKGGEWDVSVY